MNFSSAVFDKYLKALDPGRSYFLQSDIKDFEQFRTTLDDDLRKGDLSAPFYIFNVYQKRYTEPGKFCFSHKLIKITNSIPMKNILMIVRICRG